MSSGLQPGANAQAVTPATDAAPFPVAAAAMAAFFNDAVGAAVQVKATAGVLSSLSLVNTTAAAAYLQVFFKPAVGVVLGTTAPDAVVRLLASAALVLPLPAPIGIGGTGLTVAGTTTPGGALAAAISVSAPFQ